MSSGWVAIGLLYSFVCALVAAQLAVNKNRNGVGFFILGLVAGILGVITAVVAGPGPSPLPAGWVTVNCNRCGTTQNVRNGQGFACFHCGNAVPPGIWIRVNR